jgi:hypothetical protein
MMDILNEELQRTMSYVGFPTVKDTDQSALRRLVHFNSLVPSTDSSTAGVSSAVAF